MEFEYKGGNCIVISSKQATVVVDGKISSLGLKDYVVKDEIEIATQPQFATGDCRVSIDMPGEYEVSNVSIVGIPATRLIDYDESKKATIYRLVFADVTVAVLGHIANPLGDEQLEAIGVVDVLIVPVGGNGYTLDARMAAEMVRKVDPKVVIPTHYADKQSRYEVNQDELEPFIKELGATHETVAKWKVKNGTMPETLTVMELTRSA
ncbi:MAG TPA: MBL fold metallo-hydrolase [Candidatus Saccharibacteria bacterium]|nr:MBL fold metallo-hydrolase [Candidatus Saccharibacteria bacterium]